MESYHVEDKTKRPIDTKHTMNRATTGINGFLLWFIMALPVQVESPSRLPEETPQTTMSAVIESLECMNLSK
jgi:hypothetical protein